MRAVVDPNVLVSAWISPHGFPRRILDAADTGDFEMVVSQRLLAELADVLSRERMRRYGSIERAQAYVQRAMRVGVHLEIDGEPERIVPDDPKDDYLVALAIESGADYLVSGDPHLMRPSYARGPSLSSHLASSATYCETAVGTLAGQHTAGCD